MPNLVLVHGYLGGSAQWRDQIEAFSSDFSVLTPDLPGFGRSSQQQAPDTIGEFAAGVLAALAAGGVDTFHLLGHSMGGMIAQEMVAQAPSRVERLVLYSTGSIGALPGRFESIAASKRRVVTEGVQATSHRTAATWFLDGEQAENYPLCAELADRVSEQAALAGLSAMEAWSGEKGLSQITSPTLVVWGDQDRTYTWQQTHKLWREIAGASLSVIPGCAHAVHLEKSELFNAVLSDFFRDM